MKLFLEERVSKDKKMGKKKARVRSNIPKFHAGDCVSSDQSLKRAGYTPTDEKVAGQDVMLCIGADDFKYNYTEGGICVMTTLDVIKKTMEGFKSVDAEVGQQRRIRKRGGLVICEVKGDPKWYLSLAKMKKFVESYTPEQLWDMGDGGDWQEWIDTITHYYILKCYVSGQEIAVCDPLKSMRGTLKDGDCVIAQQVCFKKPTESTVPKHLR